MKILIIINDSPYGTEKAYNAFRLANQFVKDYSESTVNIFLLADAVVCGIQDQKTPDGYYNIGRMIKLFNTKGGQIKACGSCMEARGIRTEMLQSGVQKGSMQELALWVFEADKEITF